MKEMKREEIEKGNKRVKEKKIEELGKGGIKRREKGEQ